MAQVINTNSLSLLTQNNLNKSQSSLSSAIERLSSGLRIKEGANKRGNSSRLTQSFHFFMFEPIFSPVNALNQPI
ncbi:TPA: hypothetical protein ACQIUU_003255 [Escherichia coli]